MFILRDLLTPLQEQFSTTQQGQKRKVWFVYTELKFRSSFCLKITRKILIFSL